MAWVAPAVGRAKYCLMFKILCRNVSSKMVSCGTAVHACSVCPDPPLPLAKVSKK